LQWWQLEQNLFLTNEPRMLLKTKDRNFWSAAAKLPPSTRSGTTRRFPVSTPQARTDGHNARPDNVIRQKCFLTNEPRMLLKTKDRRFAARRFWRSDHRRPQGPPQQQSEGQPSWLPARQGVENPGQVE
jgi:hypothetical protein